MKKRMREREQGEKLVGRGDEKREDMDERKRAKGGMGKERRRDER